MGYLQEFEAELVNLLKTAPGPDAIVNWVKDEILKSYRNGLAEGRKTSASSRRSKQE